MDLTSITHQKLLQQLGNTQQAGALLNISKLPEGSRITATVDAVTFVDSTLREKLVTLTAHSNTASAAKNTLIAQPHLYLARLTALGKKFVAFTALELQAKQQVPVLIKKDGQAFIEVTKTSSLASSHLSSVQHNNLTKTFNNEKNSTLLTHINQAKSSQKNIIHEFSKLPTSTLANSLKQYLPLQKNMSEIFTKLNQVAKLENNQRLIKDLNLLSSITTKTLALLDKAPETQQLTNAGTLKSLLKNSGIFFEQKILSLNNDKGYQATQRTPINTPLQGESNQKINSPGITTKEVFQDDLKADVLRIINTLTNFSQELSKHPQKNQFIERSSFDKLMQSLFNISSTTNNSKINWQDAHRQFITRLEPLLLSALARLTSLQVQQLLQKQQDSTVSSGGLFEFPVRINDEFFPLTISIQERYYENKEQTEGRDKDNKDTAKLKKRWHVFLEFDLQKLGTFASDITVDDHSVKTTLWIEQKQLWLKGKRKLETLKQEMKKNGIELEEIQCIQGKPPEKPMKLQQTLIDIKT
ncbi:hypothetical protein [Agarilytica rhodophyticola]|uniref:hypothetical protein n=1 Tax=Agarilytica rhodophyticola TaxID=1737490 RepID=UPI000B345234|nr:hypothetical protein [Agarilytica rhodophyticola]